MTNRLLTIEEVSGLLGMVEANVLRMAQEGLLPTPIMVDGKPHFPEEPIMRRREEEDEAVPSAGVYLSTGEEPGCYYRVVKASHVVRHKGWPFAAFTLWDESLHIRPWLSHVVDDLPAHECILLSCEDGSVPEVRLEDLPKPTSVVWGYQWAGQHDLDDNIPVQL